MPLRGRRPRAAEEEARHVVTKTDDRRVALARLMLSRRPLRLTRCFSDPVVVIAMPPLGLCMTVAPGIGASRRRGLVDRRCGRLKR